MTLDELHRTVVEGFAELRRENRESRAAIDARFGEMDARFDGIDARFGEMDARFGEMDTRFGEMDARFGEIAPRFREQEETIRRHFDVMVEKGRGVGATSRRRARAPGDRRGQPRSPAPGHRETFLGLSLV